MARPSRPHHYRKTPKVSPSTPDLPYAHRILTPWTAVLIIGCGTYHPIEAYETKSASPYPIYTNPDLSLYQLFEFKSTLAGEAKGEPVRDYMQGLGSSGSRIWGGLKGALSDLGNVSNVGPKSQNGGEVIVSPGQFLHTPVELMADWNPSRTDGQCEYIYRMQNTVDHTNLSELRTLLKANANAGETHAA